MSEEITTISVTKKTYKQIRSLKRGGESFDELLNRVLLSDVLTDSKSYKEVRKFEN